MHRPDDMPSIVVDLHAHLPMHLRPRGGDGLLDAMRSREGRWRLLERVDGWFLSLAEGFSNRRSFFGDPRVNVPLLRRGHVGLALSVLYLPGPEMDLTGLAGPRYGQPGSDDYFAGLLRQLTAVERDVDAHYADDAAFVRSWGELEDMLDEGKLALIHCVEGGFHLGPTAESVERNIEVLAQRGIAYITLAHLFWRGIATNEPVPPLTHAWCRRVFPQPPIGLSDLGRTCVRAMAKHSILVDVTHMSARAVDDTFATMDEVDPGRAIPVIASHATVRFDRHRYGYGLDPPTIERIADRGGVIGLIVADNLVRDGLAAPRPRSLQETADVLFRHIDRLYELTGSHRHVAIGSDLGGFIKPLAGLEDSAKLCGLLETLVLRYGTDAAEAILAGNALRILRVPLQAHD